MSNLLFNDYIYPIIAQWPEINHCIFLYLSHSHGVVLKLFMLDHQQWFNNLQYSSGIIYIVFLTSEWDFDVDAVEVHEHFHVLHCKICFLCFFTGYLLGHIQQFGD